MQGASELNDSFGLGDVLTFDEPHPGMPRACINTPACTAKFYLQGAHLAAWQPAGAAPVLYRSDRSHYAPGKAIRGGVPVIFPWFGAPDTSPIHTSPGASQHGFARVWPWTMRFAALAGEDVHLSTTLDQTEGVRALGFSGFELGYEVILGRTLTVRLSVVNTGDAPFFFEEALHAYLAVGDSEQAAVTGLGDTEFLDKTDGFARKQQTGSILKFHGETDRPYLNTSGDVLLGDPVLHRRLRLRKSGSRSTVTWNPGAELAAKLPDLTPDDWQRFVCLETANVADNALTLQPGEAHTMEMQLSLETL